MKITPKVFPYFTTFSLLYFSSLVTSLGTRSPTKLSARSCTRASLMHLHVCISCHGSILQMTEIYHRSMYLRTLLCPQMNRYRHHQTETPSLPFDTCEKPRFLAPVRLSSPIRCASGAAARRKIIAQVDLECLVIP